MHHPNQTINTPANVATRFAGSENVSRTSSIDAIVSTLESITSGTAPLSVVYEWAFKAIALASHRVGSIDLGDLDHMYAPQARLALDEIESGRSYLKLIAPAFDKYPEVANSIKHHLSALFYAEATLIPFYMLSNKTAVERDTSSTSTYIVQHPVTGMIKIGRTSDVPGRIKSLQTGAGAILTTLAVIPKNIEHELHTKFSDLRRHGEWFEDVDGVISAFAKTQESA